MLMPLQPQKLVFFFSALNAEGTHHTAWGILKSPDKVSKLKEPDLSPTGKNDTLRCSRVSFRLENEVFGGDDGEEGEIEAQADREVEAITGTSGESPGVDDEVGSNYLKRFVPLLDHKYLIYRYNYFLFSEEKMA